MPFRSRGQLLAGMAALLGLCLASAGCQSSATGNNSFAVHCPDGSCGGGGGGGSGGGQGVVLGIPSSTSASTHRPLFVGRFTRSTGDEPALAKNCNCGSPVAMLRPTPVAATPAGETASAWQPVQRVGTEPPPGPQAVPAGLVSPVPSISGGGEGPILNASSASPVGNSAVLGSPQPLNALLPAVGGASQSGSFPAINTTEATPPLEGTRTTLAEGTAASRPILVVDKAADKGEQLPAPRQVHKNGNGNGVQAGTHLPQGYPDLPPVFVTHPPEAPREFAKRALSAYIVEPPDILIIQASEAVTLKNLAISGQHLVRPDGTISLGPYGDVFVAGRTLNEIKDAVAGLLSSRIWKRAPDKKEGTAGERFTIDEIGKELQVDVGVYNSKFYYVITDGGGYGAQVYRLPCTGNETVLDALAAIQGLPAQASKKKIWVARATPAEFHHPHILPVDWCAIAQRGSATTNYQIFPGDRLYVQSDPLLRLDTKLQRILSPIERLFGITLLGSSTVNSIKNGGNNGAGGTGGIGR